MSATSTGRYHVSFDYSSKVSADNEEEARAEMVEELLDYLASAPLDAFNYRMIGRPVRAESVTGEATDGVLG